ncbi:MULTISPECIES: IS66 family insertion sequence element accessory protein TnpA [unclassified Blautia]|uniref:IS66 family insertion sequence element accessory protein TnpA n=1 Tax=unclassified Blautia TaxID=2648079 RepID=UPI003F8C204F
MEQNAMAVREQQWLETIQTAKKSGLPVNQWCHENGIAESTFYRWQQRIRQHLPGSAEPTFVELPEQAKPLTSAQPVHLITVHIQDVTVELPSGLPAAQISELIRGIRHAGWHQRGRTHLPCLRLILRVFLSSSFLDIAIFTLFFAKKMRITYFM